MSNFISSCAQDGKIRTIFRYAIFFVVVDVMLCAKCTNNFSHHTIAFNLFIATYDDSLVCLLGVPRQTRQICGHFSGPHVVRCCCCCKLLKNVWITIALSNMDGKRILINSEMTTVTTTDSDFPFLILFSIFIAMMTIVEHNKKNCKLLWNEMHVKNIMQVQGYVIICESICNAGNDNREDRSLF